MITEARGGSAGDLVGERRGLGGGVYGGAEEFGGFGDAFGGGDERVLVLDRDHAGVRAGHLADQRRPPGEVVTSAGHGEGPGHLIGWRRPPRGPPPGAREGLGGGDSVLGL